MGDVGEFINKAGEIAEANEIETEVEAHLQLEIGHHRGEVTIAHALAVAVDRSLNLAGASADRGKGIGDTDTSIVVGVDSHCLAEFGNDRSGDLLDEIGEATAVGFAEND